MNTKKYALQITESKSCTETIEASSEEEAINKFIELIRDEHIVLNTTCEEIKILNVKNKKKGDM